MENALAHLMNAPAAEVAGVAILATAGLACVVGVIVGTAVLIAEAVDAWQDRARRARNRRNMRRRYRLALGLGR